MAALIILVLTLVMGGILPTGLSNEAKEVCLAFYFMGIMVTGERVYRMAGKDQRGLAYGPNELIEESRLAHERHMEVMKRQQ